MEVPAITTDLVDSARAALEAEPRYALAQNAVTRADVKEVLPRRQQTVLREAQVYSKKLKEMKVTNQKQSGRCWLFAALNCMRLALRDKLNLGDKFELSQPFLFFWDKFERANYFTRAIVETLGEDLDSRVVQHLLADPMGDGGQWDMVVNVVCKYGVVPKDAYPESKASSASREMNAFLTAKLRQFACELRTKHADGALTAEALESMRGDFMSMFYRVLCIFLGTPPSAFTWEYYDKKNEYHCLKDQTPLQFYKDVVPFDMEDFVSVIHDPRNPSEKKYTVKYLGNVVGGVRENVVHLNTSIDNIRTLCKKQLDAESPVWFGVDVGKEYHRKLALMDTELFDYDLVFGTTPTMTKADRLRYGQSLMTHAMVFTGYDEADGEITKWRVENSWGKDVGDDGYYTMANAWFDEYLYQIVAPKAMVAELIALDDETIHELPPWDPMGALAL